MTTQQRLLLSTLLTFVLFSGCATIQTYEILQQPTNETLRTHINGVVFRVGRSSDLPNAFGKADVFGGKVDRGYLELRYVGLAADGRILLRLTDLETRSTATTMSRYGGGTVQVTSTDYGSWSTARGVYIPPPEGRTEVLPPNTVEFVFDPAENPLVIGKFEVTFEEATSQSLTYRLREVAAAGS
jgi:hypothetical protein